MREFDTDGRKRLISARVSELVCFFCKRSDSLDMDFGWN